MYGLAFAYMGQEAPENLRRLAGQEWAWGRLQPGSSRLEAQSIDIYREKQQRSSVITICGRMCISGIKGVLQVIYFRRNWIVVGG